jgi:ubiquinone/menaquinone biosynthesis C-methylase UbiE
MDFEKMERYYQKVLSSMYDESERPFHRSLACQIVDDVIVPLGLPKNSKILDLNSGLGYFLSEMRKRGFDNLVGIARTPEEKSACLLDEHDVIVADSLFLDDANNSVDLIFARHSLAQSPFPYLTLLEYNRVIKIDGLLYVEVSTPNSTRKHEYNPNYFSVMGEEMWKALFARAGFSMVASRLLEVTMTNAVTGERFPETYYMFLLQKKETMI